MKYSNEITEEICKYLRAGNNQHDSAILSGISEETFYDWQRPESKQYHSEFSEALKKAENECKARNIAFVQKAAEKTWQAAAWYLERRYSNEFALKQINELVGKDGQPLNISVKLDLAGGYIPPMGGTFTTSRTSATGFTPVQDTGVAQKSKKNDNSTNGDSKASAI